MEYQYGQNDNEEQKTYNYYGNGSYGNGNYGNNNYGNGSYNSYPGDSHKSSKKKKSGAGLVVLCIVCSLFAGIIGGAAGYFVMSVSTKQKMSESTQTEQITQNVEGVAGVVEETGVSDVSKQPMPKPVNPDGVLTVEQIAQECLPSVVAITNKGETEIRSMWGTFTQESESSGSGVIIEQTDTELLIVTNYHVVEGNESLSVLFSYQENAEDLDDTQIVSAKVKDYDADRDLAIIAVDLTALSEETFENIKKATMGDSEMLTLGEQVVAIGNALGYGQSVTTGVVSALSRSIDMEDGTEGSNEYIQTDAAINPGNSGGALFNMYGQLVGINSAKMAGAQIEGMGYSIPITDIKEELETMMLTETRDIIPEEERGWLGISGANVTSDISKQWGIPQGAFISSVTANSPAEQAGLRKEMVITELNGKSVSSMDDLKSYLSYYKAGETVELTVLVRGETEYKEKKFQVVLGTMEEAGVTANESQPQQEMPYNNGNGYSPFGFFPW